MTPDAARTLLQNNGYDITSEADLNNGHGTSFRCASGPILNIYNTGRTVVQGKNTEELKKLLGDNGTAKVAIKPNQASNTNRNVFVVYGHDGQARTELEAMLRRWGLQPQILDQLATGGQTIIEKLESAIKDVSFAIVLATPDDEGHRAGHPDEKSFRARQNVVLELGMMLTKLGRDRVAILMQGQVEMERPSDIQGLIYIPFKDDVKEAALQLAKEINSRGIHIDLNKV